jgi:hypothetical protein
MVLQMRADLRDRLAEIETLDAAGHRLRRCRALGEGLVRQSR